ncbi:MAG: enoyl-CoA hydratase-related protein [Desulfobaccales bacterium]
MSFTHILLTKSQGIATLTFNRPEKLNALNQDMTLELRQALDDVSQDPGVRVLILTGQGRAFMAGADVKTFLGVNPLTARRFVQRAHDFLFRLEALPIPVIAAVHGFALGAGFEIALACDFIYAAESAKLGLPEITLGIIPGAGGTQRLTRLVGRSLAKEIIMTGRMLEAGEARSASIVAQVFPEDRLYEETLKTAQTLAQKGRLALEAAKKAVDRGADVDLRNGCALEVDLFALCFASSDPQEGVKAFLEKRPAVFQEEPA